MIAAVYKALGENALEYASEERLETRSFYLSIPRGSLGDCSDNAAYYDDLDECALRGVI